MNFDDILLALIARKPRSGYQLKKWLDVEGTFIRANADQSQIYRTLRRLEKAGLISHEVVRGGGPDARIFALTPDGADRLRALADAPYEPPARWQEPDFLARVSLLGPVAPATIIDVIDREIAFRREQMARFRGRLQEIDADRGLIDFDADLIEAMGGVLDEFGRRSTDDWVAWLERLREIWSELLSQSSAVTADSSTSSSRS